MKILVIGSGGREHALIRKLKQSPKAEKIYCIPGNGGISKDAECIDIPVMDIDRITAFAQENQIDLVVVAPDDPLASGMVDALDEKGIRTFGPCKAAAQIEASKVFSKNLMRDFNIPTANYEVFDNAQKAFEYIRKKSEYPVVIKADGLALGKGVIIAANEEEAHEGLKEIMEDKVFGKSGDHVVVEEFITGPEVSVLAFVDGKTVKPMVSAMDHKRALDNDQGLNTGGMGTIAPNPFYTETVAKNCMEKIFIPTINAMKELGHPFKGCLFFGLMITADGPKVIEYNCRFGDPETQVVLELLDSDLLEIMLAVYDERLDEAQVKFSNKSAACVVLASGGYPKSYRKGFEISGLDETGQCSDVAVYHAGTKLSEGKFCTNGGRVLGVSATGNTLSEAIESAYTKAKKIHFEGVFYRGDIGAKCLK